MNKLIKRVFVGASLCAILSMVSIPAFASLLPYSTSDAKNMDYIGGVINDTTSTKTIHANTNPTSGQSGVVVYITDSANVVKAKKQFPFYTSVSDLTSSVKISELRRIQVTSVQSGQLVTGEVSVSLK